MIGLVLTLSAVLLSISISQARTTYHTSLHRPSCRQNLDCPYIQEGVSSKQLCKHHTCYKGIHDYCSAQAYEKCPSDLCQRVYPFGCVPHEEGASRWDHSLTGLDSADSSQERRHEQPFEFDSAESLNLHQEYCFERNCPPDHCFYLNNKCLPRNARVYVPARGANSGVVSSSSSSSSSGSSEWIHYK